MSQRTPARIGVVERVGYAVGDTASNLYWQTVSIFLVYFYTDVFGLSASAAAVMILVTRSWDTLIDPIMGSIADRTRSRYGRFRPWLLWGAAPFALAGFLAFVTPPFGPSARLAYAYVTYSLMMLTYTVVNVPYGALLGVISPSPSARTALSSYRFLGAQTGVLIVNGTLLPLVHALGGGNERLGFPLAMAIYGAVAGSLFVYCFAVTRERISPPPAQKSSVAEDAADLSRNRPWIVLCVASVLVLLGVSVRGAATLYYFKYFVLSETLASTFMVVGTAATLLGVASTSTLSRVLGGKKRALLVLLAGTIGGFIVFQLAGPHDVGVMFASQIVGSYAGGPLFPLIWSMYADTADYAEWKTGRRATGLVFSTATFAQKIGWTIGGALAGWILASYGFRANVEQSAQALAGICAMMGWIPAVLCTLGTIVAYLYNLDARTLDGLEAELRDRRRTFEATTGDP